MKHKKICKYKKIITILSHPEWMFVAIALLTGLCFAILLPAGASLDEPNHIARATSAADGNIIPILIPDKLGYTSEFDVQGIDANVYGGPVDSALFDLSMNNTVHFYVGPGNNTIETYQFPTWNTESVISDLEIGNETHLEAFSNTAVNMPLAYAPHIIGYWLSSLITDNAYAIIITMRIFGLLFFVLVIFLCIKMLPIGKWILTSIALIPSTILIASSVTADTVTFVACSVFVTVILRNAAKDQPLSIFNWTTLLMSATSIALIKSSYMPILILLILIPIANKYTRNMISIIQGCCIGVFSCIIFFLWYHLIAKINTGAMFNVGASPTLQMDYITSHPTILFTLLIKEFLAQNFFNLGSLGALDGREHLLYSGWITIVIICCAILLDNKHNTDILISKNILITVCCLTSFLCIFALTSIAVYTQFTSVGARTIEGVQSRYFLPALILLLLPFSLIQCSSWTERESLASRKKLVGAMWTLQCLSSVFTLCIFISALFL